MISGWQQFIFVCSINLLIYTETYLLNYVLRKSSKSTSQSSTVLYGYNCQIFQNHKQLMEVWNGCVKENLEIEVQWRIIGCSPMMSFKFFNGINISFTIYWKHFISAVKKWQKTAKLSYKTLEKLQSQKNNDAFFDMVKSKAKKNQFHWITISSPKKENT